MLRPSSPEILMGMEESFSDLVGDSGEARLPELPPTPHRADPQSWNRGCFELNDGWADFRLIPIAGSERLRASVPRRSHRRFAAAALHRHSNPNRLVHLR